MSRSDLLLSLFDTNGRGLEISPSYNPLLPKAAGYQIETVDHASAEQLREKYRFDPHVDISRIEEVDYVCDAADIAHVVNASEKYDFIVASHVIEHIPDMLRFLKSCETLLKPDGRLVLAIPDKRYCFDVFQSLTTTGDLLQSHLEQRRIHRPGAIFDFIAYRAVRDGRITWASDDPTRLAYEYTLEQATARYEASKTSDEYYDIHAWRFTPSSFRLIICDLVSLGILQLRETAFHSTVGFEFFTVLSKAGAGCPETRIALAVAAIEEQKAIITSGSVSV